MQNSVDSGGLGEAAARSARFLVNGRFLTQRPTGVQRWALEITRQIARRLDGLVVAVPGRARLDARADGLNLLRVGRLSGHLWEQLALPRAFRRTGARLLFCPANTGPLAVSRQVLTVTDVSFLREPCWFSWRFRRLYGALVPRVARRAAAVLTISEFSRREIAELVGVPAERLFVVPAAPSRPFIGDTVLEASGPAGDYVLAVGSLDPRKNLRRLLGAWKLLDRRDVELRIVGAGSSVFADPRVSALVDADKRVHFEGFVSDYELERLYRGARMLVFPSLYEGFGLPAIEAMACGCPVVSANAGSLPEVCGEAAELVDPLDERDIARGIRVLLDDEARRRELISRGVERASEFSWERSGELLAARLEELAARV